MSVLFGSLVLVFRVEQPWTLAPLHGALIGIVGLATSRWFWSAVVVTAVGCGGVALAPEVKWIGRSPAACFSISVRDGQGGPVADAMVTIRDHAGRRSMRQLTWYCKTAADGTTTLVADATTRTGSTWYCYGFIRIRDRHAGDWIEINPPAGRRIRLRYSEAVRELWRNDARQPTMSLDGLVYTRAGTRLAASGATELPLVNLEVVTP